MFDTPTLGQDGDRGVSPVIGVILMVAITVILAAVIASFVLGLGDQTNETAPNVNFNGDFGDSDFTLSVDTAQSNADAGDFEFVVRNDSGDATESLSSFDGFGDTINAGDSQTFDANTTETNLNNTGGNIYENATEIQVIFRGDNEQVFDTFEIPEDWEEN